MSASSEGRAFLTGFLAAKLLPTPTDKPAADDRAFTSTMDATLEACGVSPPKDKRLRRWLDFTDRALTHGEEFIKSQGLSLSREPPATPPGGE